MNDTTMYIITGLILITLLVGAVVFIRSRRGLRFKERNNLHPLLLLGIIFLIPGLMNLIMDGEESVFLTMGVVFTISGIVAQLLIRTPQESQARKRSLIGSLIGFSVGAAIGAALSLVFDWPLILMIVLLGAFGLLIGMLLGRLYQRRVQA